MPPRPTLWKRHQPAAQWKQRLLEVQTKVHSAFARLTDPVANMPAIAGLAPRISGVLVAAMDGSAIHETGLGPRDAVEAIYRRQTRTYLTPAGIAMVVLGVVVLCLIICCAACRHHQNQGQLAQHTVPGSCAHGTDTHGAPTHPVHHDPCAHHDPCTHHAPDAHGCCAHQGSCAHGGCPHHATCGHEMEPPPPAYDPTDPRHGKSGGKARIIDP